MEAAPDLVEQLLAIAGSRLEDGSAIALAMERPCGERIAELQSLNADLGYLLAAAITIQRRMVD